MTSKKLGALLRSVPPATVGRASPTTQEEPVQAAGAAIVHVPSGEERGFSGQGGAATDRVEGPEREVPLQVLVPAGVRRRLALHCANEGESLRSVMLRAIRALGIEVSDAEIAGKRGRKSY